MRTVAGWSQDSPVSNLPELLAEITRGGEVESRHFGHVAVVDTSGRVLFSLGDPDQPIYPRSSLKPLQALAGLARGTADRFHFTDAEVAVTCASHSAEPRHRSAVAALLERIGATEADLRCGPHSVPDPASRDELIRAGKSPTAIYNNCSGKHTGMLALARVLGAPLPGYWEAEHPVQREIQRVLAAACGTDLTRLHWGVDGCGVPTYRMPLRQLALGFARLANPETLEADRPAGERIVRSMNAEPEMVRGEGGFDTVVMRALPGLTICKGGAEGCQAIGLPGRGIGIALKIEDGGARAIGPIAMALLKRLDLLPEPLPEALRLFAQPVVLNTRDEVVGEIRPSPRLGAVSMP